MAMQILQRTNHYALRYRTVPGQDAWPASATAPKWPVRGVSQHISSAICQAMDIEPDLIAMQMCMQYGLKRMDLRWSLRQESAFGDEVPTGCARCSAATWSVDSDAQSCTLGRQHLQL
jgi:hypothetical protein